jgi:hypothetical protein
MLYLNRRGFYRNARGAEGQFPVIGVQFPVRPQFQVPSPIRLTTLRVTSGFEPDTGYELETGYWALEADPLEKMGRYFAGWSRKHFRIFTEISALRAQTWVRRFGGIELAGGGLMAYPHFREVA